MPASRNPLSVALCPVAAVIALALAPVPIGASRSRTLSTAPAGQTPVFTARVDLVQLDFVATDRAGRPVTDLRPDELEVLEGGTARKIASLARVDLPLAPAHPPYASDVATNSGVGDGRLLFLVLDDVMTLRERSASIRAVARRLLERLSPNDLVGVTWLSLGRAGAREFTSNHAAVLDAIDRFSASDTRAARRNRLDSPLPHFADDDDQPSRDAGDMAIRNIKAEFDRSRPFAILKDVCAYVSGLPNRRKAVVFLGSGPTGMDLRDMLTGPPNRDILDFTRAVTAARRANVAVYALDPAARLRATDGERDGIDTGLPSSVPRTDVPRPSRSLPLLDYARAGGGRGLEMLSLATGGLDARGANALAAADQVLFDTGAYYLVGYYADPVSGRPIDRFKAVLDATNGFRTIEVRTTRPGVTIRARAGYWAADRDAPAARPGARGRDDPAAAIAGVVAAPGLPLRAGIAPLRGTARNRHDVAVVVEVDLEGFVRAESSVEENAEIAIAAVVPGEGVKATQRARVRIPLGRSTRAATGSLRYSLCQRLALPPGQYQIRIGVRSTLAQRAGSVYADVSVPDYANDALSLSGLVLERRGGPARVAVRTRDLSGLLPVLPWLGRDFTAADEVWATVTVYAARKARPAPVVVTATVVKAEDGISAWSDEQARHFDPQGTANDGRYAVRLPLDRLAPGAYRLRITAENGDTGAVAVRELDFRVGGSGSDLQSRGLGPASRARQGCPARDGASDPAYIAHQPALPRQEGALGHR